MVNLERMKNNLRIDHDFDNEDITLLLDTAYNFIYDTLSTDKVTDTNKLDTAVILLTRYWYENQSENRVNVRACPPLIMSLIHQLRGETNGSNSDVQLET